MLTDWKAGVFPRSSRSRDKIMEERRSWNRVIAEKPRWRRPPWRWLRSRWADVPRPRPTRRRGSRSRNKRRRRKKRRRTRQPRPLPRAKPLPTSQSRSMNRRRPSRQPRRQKRPGRPQRPSPPRYCPWLTTWTTCLGPISVRPFGSTRSATKWCWRARRARRDTRWNFSPPCKNRGYESVVVVDDQAEPRPRGPCRPWGPTRLPGPARSEI